MSGLLHIRGLVLHRFVRSCEISRLFVICNTPYTSVIQCCTLFHEFSHPDRWWNVIWSSEQSPGSMSIMLCFMGTCRVLYPLVYYSVCWMSGKKQERYFGELVFCSVELKRAWVWIQLWQTETPSYVLKPTLHSHVCFSAKYLLHASLGTSFDRLLH